MPFLTRYVKMGIKDIIKEIMRYIGSRGIVAGGAVRDLVLGRKPKDIDVFIFYEKDFRRIVKRGIFDKKPQKTERPFEANYPSTFEVYNTTLHGYPVQLIWNDHVEETFKKNIRATDIINCFDFTINMMYIGGKRNVFSPRVVLSTNIFITDEAQESINERRIIFNPGHHSGISSSAGTAKFLMKRMVYLACKLDFVIAPNTIQQVIEKYSGFCSALEAVEWR